MMHPPRRQQVEKESQDRENFNELEGAQRRKWIVRDSNSRSLNQTPSEGSPFFLRRMVSMGVTPRD